MAIQYHFIIQAYLAPRWSAWFDDLTITNLAEGRTLLAGPIADQAALYGVLIKIRDLGLPLLAVLPVTQGNADSDDALKGNLR